MQRTPTGLHIAFSATLTLTTLTLILAATSPRDSLLPAPVEWALAAVSSVLLLVSLVELFRADRIFEAAIPTSASPATDDRGTRTTTTHRNNPRRQRTLQEPTCRWETSPGSSG
ncbi:hypothetical protein SAMN04487820_10215 [Actinopolyspora mzabensis]|uniref:Uncharacterized protein n=1 Tax=Actinopolyspora mzabensis TaxID=995066 RepID=A0A1G8WFM2_ACTMZ|nr:hypothetical protein SAMN04487820_10215 [Actinopolyspora mzabensis]